MWIQTQKNRQKFGTFSSGYYGQSEGKKSANPCIFKVYQDIRTIVDQMFASGFLWTAKSFKLMHLTLKFDALNMWKTKHQKIWVYRSHCSSSSWDPSIFRPQFYWKLLLAFNFELNIYFAEFVLKNFCKKVLISAVTFQGCLPQILALGQMEEHLYQVYASSPLWSIIHAFSVNIPHWEKLTFSKSSIFSV